MRRLFIAPVLAAGLLFTALLPAGAQTGLVVKESRHSVPATISLLEESLKAAGVTVFARIDHAAGAEKAELPLRPTELLVFGNPKLGTPLMQSNQAAGIDLPLKALAYQDADGKVFLVYNDPDYLSQRHDLGDKAAVIEKISGALAKFSDAATK